MITVGLVTGVTLLLLFRHELLLNLNIDDLVTLALLCYLTWKLEWKK